MSFLFRVFLFFSLFFLTNVSAKEEWTIKQFNNLSFAQVAGEVTHGDHLSWVNAHEQGNWRSIHSEEYKRKTEKEYKYY